MNSPRWALMRPFLIRVPSTGEKYLWRLRIIETPWFGVYLHRIYRPDGDRHLHDHPWPFVSFLLWGFYDEVVEGRFFSRRLVRRRCLSVKRAIDAHQIVRVSARCWSLVFRGRRCREWGFVTESGWVDFRTYLGLEDAA